MIFRRPRPTIRVPRGATRTIASCAVLAAALLAGHAALAEPARPSGAQAEGRRAALYREGVALAKAGNWEEAVERFRQVVAIRSAPPALFTLAQAEEHLGHLSLAEHAYDRALTEARASGASDVAAAAQQALSAIESRVPRILIKLPRPVASATASLDGASSPIGEPVKVDPGDHHVVVSAPRKRPFQLAVRLTEGQSLDVDATLDDNPSAPVAPPAAPSAPPEPALAAAGAAPSSSPSMSSMSSMFPVGPVILGGAGVVAGVVGLIVRLRGQAMYDAANAHCTAGVCSNPTDVDAAGSGRTQIVTGTVVLGGGLAAIVGAGVWWALLPPKRQRVDAPSVNLGIGPTGDGVRGVLSGEF